MRLFGRERCALRILNSKCALRQNGGRFFDISTSKSGPNMVSFVILTSKCASRHNGGALFFTSQLPTVVRTSCALCILTWTCASRHNGVQLFISHLARWLCTRRFSEPTFRPSGATNHWKNTAFRDFATFSRTCIFCLMTLCLPWYSFFFSLL